MFGRHGLLHLIVSPTHNLSQLAARAVQRYTKFVLFSAWVVVRLVVQLSFRGLADQLPIALFELPLAYAQYIVQENGILDPTGAGAVFGLRNKVLEGNVGIPAALAIGRFQDIGGETVANPQEIFLLLKLVVDPLQDGHERLLSEIFRVQLTQTAGEIENQGVKHASPGFRRHLAGSQHDPSDDYTRLRDFPLHYSPVRPITTKPA